MSEILKKLNGVDLAVWAEKVNVINENDAKIVFIS